MPHSRHKSHTWEALIRQLKRASKKFKKARDGGDYPDVEKARQAEAEYQAVWKNLRWTLQRLAIRYPDDPRSKIITADFLNRLPKHPTTIEDVVGLIALLDGVSAAPSAPRGSGTQASQPSVTAPVAAIERHRMPATDQLPAEALPATDDENLLAGAHAVSYARAAEYLHLSERQIRNLVQNGQLESTGKGHYKKILSESLRRYKGTTNPTNSGTVRN